MKRLVCKVRGGHSWVLIPQEPNTVVMTCQRCSAVDRTIPLRKRDPDAVPHAFTDSDNWTGGWYELAIELDGDDGLMDRAIRAVCDAAQVDGCYAYNDREPAEQDRLPCTLASLTGSRLYGRVRVPSGTEVVCGLYAQGEEDGSYWLTFYLPLGALGLAYPAIGGYPVDERSGSESLLWRAPIDQWLADVGSQVYAAAPYRLGLVGFELLMAVDATEVTSGQPLPPEHGYLIPADGTVRYLPATV